MVTEDSYNIQSIYTLKFNNYNNKHYTLRLGRKDCEIKIPHTSISRLHATIVYSKGEFRLFDNNSKYGTLLKLKKPLKITHQKQGLQIGRSVIIVQLKQCGELTTQRSTENVEQVQSFGKRKDDDLIKDKKLKKLLKEMMEFEEEDI